MQIFLDDRPLTSAHRFRGIGSYTRNLIKALKEIDKQNLYLDSNNKAKPDLIHYPYFDLFETSLPLVKSFTTLVTVYDTIPLIFPRHFPVGIRGRFKLAVQKYSLAGAKAVITISQNSKKDIVKYLGVPEEKIFVTYLAPGEEFKKLEVKNQMLKVKQKYNLPDIFVLYVGDVNWHKNLVNLVKAMQNIGSEASLVMAGKAFKQNDLKETQTINRLVKELGISKRVIMPGYVSEAELAAIYNLATVYCQPSVYEGFGLPVLEAMACGCPVLAVNCASLPEVAGQAVLSVKSDSDNIARGLSKLMASKDLRSALVEKGYRQVNKFSWHKTARETLAVYQAVGGQKYDGKN